MRAHPRERGVGGLLHHLAELAGDAEPSAAGIRARLDEEDVASGRGDCKAGRHTRVGGALAHLAGETPWAEPTAHAALVDPRRAARLALCHPPRRLAGKCGQLAFEVADPGLARVLADHGSQRAFGDRDPLEIESVRLELLR